MCIRPKSLNIKESHPIQFHLIYVKIKWNKNKTQYINTLRVLRRKTCNFSLDYFTCWCCSAAQHLSTDTCLMLIETQANIQRQNSPEEKCQILPSVLGSSEPSVTQRARKDKSFHVCRDATGVGNRGRHSCFEVIFRPKSSFGEQTVFHHAYKSQPATEAGIIVRVQELTAHVQSGNCASKRRVPESLIDWFFKPLHRLTDASSDMPLGQGLQVHHRSKR